MLSVGSSKKDPVPIPEAQKGHPMPKLEAQKGTLSSGTSPVLPSMKVPPPPGPRTTNDYVQLDAKCDIDLSMLSAAPRSWNL